MTPAPALGLAVIESLDGPALDLLAERLAGRLVERLAHVEQDRWLTAFEAATHLGLSVSALHKLTAARTIPFEQDAPGCKLWFRRSDLDRWRTGGSTRGADASSALPRRPEAAS